MNIVTIDQLMLSKLNDRDTTVYTERINDYVFNIDCYRVTPENTLMVNFTMKSIGCRKDVQASIFYTDIPFDGLKDKDVFINHKSRFDDLSERLNKYISILNSNFPEYGVPFDKVWFKYNHDVIYFNTLLFGRLINMPIYTCNMQLCNLKTIENKNKRIVMYKECIYNKNEYECGIATVVKDDPFTSFNKILSVRWKSGDTRNVYKMVKEEYKRMQKEGLLIGNELPIEFE